MPIQNFEAWLKPLLNAHDYKRALRHYRRKNPDPKSKWEPYCRYYELYVLWWTGDVTETEVESLIDGWLKQ